MFSPGAVIGAGLLRTPLQEEKSPPIHPAKGATLHRLSAFVFGRQPDLGLPEEAFAGVRVSISSAMSLKKNGLVKETHCRRLGCCRCQPCGKLLHGREPLQGRNKTVVYQFEIVFNGRLPD